MILDGWGYREEASSNAILKANTPVLDNLKANYPNMLIETSGMAVGLPDGQMGNSEVGHVNLGAGRIVYQDFTRITKAIEEGEFNQTPALCQAVDKAVANDKAVHIFGLLSPGGVHSHEDHIFAMMELAKTRGAKKVYLHAFLDGRDTPPRSAKASLEKAQQKNTKEFPKKTTQPVVTKQNVVQSQQAVGVGGLFEVEEGKSTFFKLPNGDTESISVSKVWEMHGYLYTGFNGKRI